MQVWQPRKNTETRCADFPAQKKKKKIEEFILKKKKKDFFFQQSKNPISSI